MTILGIWFCVLYDSIQEKSVLQDFRQCFGGVDLTNDPTGSKSKAVRYKTFQSVKYLIGHETQSTAFLL